MIQYSFVDTNVAFEIPEKMDYCEHNTCFGKCFFAWNKNKVYAVIFAENELMAKLEFITMYSTTTFTLNNEKAQMLLEKTKTGDYIFQITANAFSIKTLKALLITKNGQITTYKQIAEATGSNKAYRAVGTAVGNNRIAWFLPCHRVIRSDRKIGDYRWGKDLKEKMLQWEKDNPEGDYFGVFI